MTRPLTDEAAARARLVLRSCAAPLGLRASASEDGYREVWTRDAMVALLGACADGREELVPALRATLETLSAHQSALGYVPLNVDPDGRRSTANAGALDSNLWYVLGHYFLHRTFGTADLLERHRDAIARAMLWARYQDSDDDGLIEGQEAADWADLLAYRGKVLYPNVLYVLALRAYASLAGVIDLPDAATHLAAASRAVERLNALHWVESHDGLWDRAPSPALRGDHSESRRLAQSTVSQLWSRPFYLPWVGFRDFGDWCDVLGNSLAVVAGVADGERTAKILRHFADVGVATPFPARAIHPSIQPGHKDWRDYYRNGNRSLPDQYHNGGAWPFIGGFFIAAHVAAGQAVEAGVHLLRLAEAVRAGREGPWEFNEWHHGVTGRPMGAPRQAWSAAMYLFAYRAAQERRVPLLGDLVAPPVTQPV